MGDLLFYGYTTSTQPEPSFQSSNTAQGLKVQYSTDGSTWTDVPATYTQRRRYQCGPSHSPSAKSGGSVPAYGYDFQRRNHRGASVQRQAAQQLQQYYRFRNEMVQRPPKTDTGTDGSADTGTDGSATQYPQNTTQVPNRFLRSTTQVHTQVLPYFSDVLPSLRTDADYNLYFGQLHSHTTLSDGAGSVTDAFAHASAVPNLDFLAVTDHSNSFESGSYTASIDVSAMSNLAWATGKTAAAAITSSGIANSDNLTDPASTFLGIYGYEMTWSDGCGHMNTFNTPGFENRNNPIFYNKAQSIANPEAFLPITASSLWCRGPFRR
jgi:hypothetical protein